MFYEAIKFFPKKNYPFCFLYYLIRYNAEKPQSPESVNYWHPLWSMDSFSKKKFLDFFNYLWRKEENKFKI